MERGLCPSRERAAALILAGRVLVADRVVDKAGTQVASEAEVRVRGEDIPYVSRGGFKLAHALDAFGIDPAGRRCLDVGASTGGFTDCLLKRGAAHVVSVDVGYGQLATSLRQDARVSVLERTNIRYLEPSVAGPGITLAVIDVSFISLKLVLPPVLALVDSGADIVPLVKPQFEVGRGKVGKGGIVRDPALRAQAVAGIREFAGREMGLRCVGETESPISGADGNVEYLLHLRQAESRSAARSTSPRNHTFHGGRTRP